MSLVLAIKDKDRVVLGSDRQASTGAGKSHDNTKIWRSDDLNGALFGAVGSMRAAQVVQYNQIIDLNDINNFGLSTRYVVNSLVPHIVQVLQEAGISCQSQDQDVILPSAFLFAYDNSAWMIWNDLSVSEITEYLVIGSGEDIAKGVLSATKDKNPFDRISTAIKAAAEHTLYVDDKINFLVTKDEKSDKKLIEQSLK